MDLKSVLGAVNQTLGVLSMVAKIPGVSMIPYVSTAAGAIDLIQFAIGKGVDVAEHVTALTDTFKPGMVPTQAQLDALDAKIAALRAAIHAPLPPKEEGEPE